MKRAAIFVLAGAVAGAVLAIVWPPRGSVELDAGGVKIGKAKG